MADFYTEIESLKAEGLKQLEKDIASKSVKPLEEDEVLKKYQEKLTELRQDSSKRGETAELTRDAVTYANTVADAYIKQVNEEQNAKEKEIKAKYAERVLEIKGATSARVAQLSKKEEINVLPYMYWTNCSSLLCPGFTFSMASLKYLFGISPASRSFLNVNIAASLHTASMSAPT